VVDVVRSAGFDIAFTIAPHDAHDTVLIRRCLAQTPAERLADLVQAVRALDEMTEVARG
jgi:hypothetical protein